MNDSLFWRAFAVLGLLVALAYVVSRFTAAPPLSAGGQGGLVLEVIDEPWQSSVGRIFVLDTNRKCLMMYGSANQRFDLTLLASRYIDIDSQATVGKEFPGKARGWPLREMQKYLESGGGPRRRTTR